MSERGVGNRLGGVTKDAGRCEGDSGAVDQEAGLASLREEGVRSRLSALHFCGFLSGEAMVAQAPAPLVALLLSPPSPARPFKLEAHPGCSPAPTWPRLRRRFDPQAM